MYDKMFKATGGARMGMRARASQNGKLARTEGGQDGAGGDYGTKVAVKDEPKDARRSPFETKREALEGPASRKRRRAAEAGAGEEGGEESSAVAATEGVKVKKEKILPVEVKKEKKSVVEVKKEKKSGDKKVPGEGEEGRGEGGAEVEPASKAERRRQRSEAKKAKRANKAAKEEGSVDSAADSDSETQAPVPARGEGEGEGGEKARKKKKRSVKET